MSVKVEGLCRGWKQKNNWGSQKRWERIKGCHIHITGRKDILEKVFSTKEMEMGKKNKEKKGTQIDGKAKYYFMYK